MSKDKINDRFFTNAGKEVVARQKSFAAEHKNSSKALAETWNALYPNERVDLTSKSNFRLFLTVTAEIVGVDRDSIREVAKTVAGLANRPDLRRVAHEIAL